MRIIINVERRHHPRRTVVRTGFQTQASDEVAIVNCGIEIYNVIKELFGDAVTIEGGEFIHEGERS